MQPMNGHGMRSLALLLLLAGGLLGGCRAAASLPPSRTWVVQWWTDFQQPGPWRLGGDEGGLARYTPTGYRLAGVQPRAQIWSVYPARYQTVRLAAHLRGDGPSGGRYGLLCGFQDTQHYFVALLTAAGAYAVWRHTVSGWQALHAPDLQPRFHPAVHPAPQANWMMVECRASGLRLWANGTLLFAADTHVPPGQVGMWLETPPSLPQAAWGAVFRDLTLWTWEQP